MESILNNDNRVGNFTSSEIVALTKTGKGALGFGAKAITYIDETNLERHLGCSIDSESNAKPLAWGKLNEGRVFSLLGLDYTLTSQETDLHPKIKFWAGSKDGMHEGDERAVIDIKCPVSRKSFIQLILPLYLGMTGIDAMKAIRDGFKHEGIEYPAHSDGEKYYWQLVSNAILNGVDFAELIVYMPKQEELADIRLSAEGDSKCYWIAFGADEELPHMPNDTKYNSINVIRFKVPQEDKELLTSLVLKAGTLLINQTFGVEGRVEQEEADTSKTLTV